MSPRKGVGQRVITGLQKKLYKKQTNDTMRTEIQEKQTEERLRYDDLPLFAIAAHSRPE